jgi:excinuclease ABC subunit C
LRTPERVFLVDRRDPIVFQANSPELFALTRLRDEAHRFAITFQRKVSRRAGLRSLLDQVPGVGPSRRGELLRHFGSLARIREANVSEIASVPGFGTAVAERVFAFLHDEQGKRAEIESDGIHDEAIADAIADRERVAEAEVSTKNGSLGER